LADWLKGLAEGVIPGIRTEPLRDVYDVGFDRLIPPELGNVSF